jgi:3-oxoacyl-[acyl-carrier protein] reductase
MDLGLRDKCFVIGGGSKGLGRAVAEVLAAEGARVLLFSRDEAALDAVAAGLGDRCAGFVVADIADPVAVETISTAVDAKLGGLDGILINAGGPPGGDVFALTDEQWLASYQLLIGGPIRLLRALVPTIEGEGAVLFITSTSVRQPITGLDTSNVLRPGVAALVKTLARQLAPRIRVNGLAPGRFNTDRIRWLDDTRAKALGMTEEEHRVEATKQIPFGRYGDPPEFGRAGAFLLSPAASYISGVTLQVDGAAVSAIP